VNYTSKAVTAKRQGIPAHTSVLLDVCEVAIYVGGKLRTTGYRNRSTVRDCGNLAGIKRLQGG
jgi:hypothetical protein